MSLLLASNVFAFDIFTYPDLELTTGIADEAVTQENISKTICKSGYTVKVRNVTEAEKSLLLMSI